MKPAAQPSSILLPFAVAALGIAVFSVMDAVMKGLSLAIGAYNAVLWRSLIAMPLSGILFLAARGRRPSPEAMRLHVIRGFITAGMAVAFFYGLTRLPLAEAVALSFIAPIIALLLAGLLLGETIRKTAILASLLGFAGVLVLLSGQYQAGHRDYSGAAAVLGSALLYAYNIVLMRQQALVAGPVEVTFFQSVTVGLFLLPFAPWFSDLPPADQLPSIAGAAVLASCSLLLLAWAYRRAQAQQLAPVEYTALIWAALFGYLFFNEAVLLSTFAGAAMIIAGCFVATRSEREPASPVEAAL